MSQQVFADPDQQLLVALSPEVLSYSPVGRAGWQCRLSDIAWTTSDMDARGVHEVRLHAPDGRVAVRIPEFEQIERFYLALVRGLAARPTLEAVREQLPTRVDLLEQVLRLAAQADAGSGDDPWQALQADAAGVVAVSQRSLLVAPAEEPSVHRIGWGDLAGLAQRSESLCVPGGAVRFYRSDSWVEMRGTSLGAAVESLCLARLAEQQDGPSFRFPELVTATPRLAMEYSWELQGALEAGVLAEDEIVVACACGAVRQVDAPVAGVREDPGPLLGAIAALGRDGGVPGVLLLTDQRLLLLERPIPGEILIAVEETPFGQLARPRVVGGRLLIGDLELETGGGPDEAREFAEAYRDWTRRAIGDPFSPVVEAVV